MAKSKLLYEQDSLGRKIIRGPEGRLTLRPKYEYWTAKPVHIVDDRRVHLQHWIKKDGKRIIANTTTYSLDKYLPAVKDAVEYVTPGTRVLEIGAGIGELIPTIVRRLARADSSFERPTVIDPCNYHAFLEMIEEMQRQNISSEEYELLERARDYASVIVDSSKVRLFSTTLGEAFRNLPSLHRNFDIVVDNWGPVAYTDTEFNPCECVFGRTFRVKCMENCFMKENGRHFTKGIDAHMLFAYRRAELTA